MQDKHLLRQKIIKCKIPREQGENNISSIREKEVKESKKMRACHSYLPNLYGHQRCCLYGEIYYFTVATENYLRLYILLLLSWINVSVEKGWK